MNLIKLKAQGDLQGDQLTSGIYNVILSDLAAPDWFHWQ